MKKTGFSIVELLVAMAILGILLGVLSMFLISNQRVTSSQITAATLNNDTRLAFLRMSEVISQAQYIFPAEQTLTLGTTNYITGQNTLAVLVPGGTTYCNLTGSAVYCGYAFTIEDRSPFSAMLGPDGGLSNLALIETRCKGLVWIRNEVPTATLNRWDDSGMTCTAGATNFTRFPVSDAVDSTSDLASQTRLTPASYSDFDKGFIYQIDTDKSQDPRNQSNGLVASVNSYLHLKRQLQGKDIKVERENFVFSRAIPRNTVPN